MSSYEELAGHCRQPKNWGSFPDRTERVLTGASNLELYSDQLYLQFKWATLLCPECFGTGKAANSAYGSSDIEFVNCSACRTFGSLYYIEAVHHVSVGCVWLIGASSWFSEYAECKRVEEIMQLTVDDIINLSGLPWAGAHCASLIKGATNDALYRGFSCLVS
ncbi:MAG: iron-sulfur cluster assembly scaffold protein [Patescibacteria group bacterium]